MPRVFQKTNIVILSEAKNLLFFFSSQKSREEILRTYVLRMTDKGKLAKILEQSHYMPYKWGLVSPFFYFTAKLGGKKNNG
jgi:hypothetical protein